MMLCLAMAPLSWFSGEAAARAHAPAIAPAASPTAAIAGAELADEVAALRAEVEALRAELRAVRPQAVAVLPASVASPAVPAAVTAAAAKAPSAVQLAFKGAPEFKGDGGWSFKPRGRLQLDGGYLEAPGSRVSGQSDGRGFTSRIRRAYIGAQGTMPGGFSYRAEVDLANNAVSWTDVYLAWDKGPFNVTLGQHHPFTSLEQLESDLYLTFNERASFITAFNMERRVGLSAGFHHGAIMANAGIFTDDIPALTNDGNKSFSMDGRLVWMPKLGDLQMHVAGSLHHRDLGKFQGSLGQQYRARPYIGTTDIRYVDTGVLTVNDETHYGAELATNWKRVHFASEAAWLRVNRPGPADPLFFGGYAEVGLFLTDDTRVYKNGQFDRVTPTHPLGGGGLGAVELNLRYDRLDLTDKGIGGGVQNGYGAALIWMPTAYVRFLVNYMHLIYDIPSQQPKFDAEVVGLRTQVDF
jgi:phosphate-selective porin OprO/OprP